MRDEEVNKTESAEMYSRQINELADQIKTLALNLAINLARSKNEITELQVLEPEFTRLVNGSVEVVKRVSEVLKAFRNEGKMVYSPNSGSERIDRLEESLNEIHDLSKDVLWSIEEIKRQKKQADKYK
jgi:uncharacterized phage infection (PIP) family protein YhgE